MKATMLDPNFSITLNSADLAGLKSAAKMRLADSFGPLHVDRRARNRGPAEENETVRNGDSIYDYIAEDLRKFQSKYCYWSKSFG